MEIWVINLLGLAFHLAMNSEQVSFEIVGLSGTVAAVRAGKRPLPTVLAKMNAVDA